MTGEERDARLQLAACYRIFDHLGWTEMIFNHITLRVPGSERLFLINPFGLHYREVTASNLLLVDIGGNPVRESKWPVNRAGFVIHGAIHAAIDQAHCIMHTHTTTGMAVASLRDGLSYTNFYAAQLHGQVAYHDFEGVTVELDEQQRLVQDIGDKRAAILRNHGLLAWGAQPSGGVHAALDPAAGLRRADPGERRGPNSSRSRHRCSSRRCASPAPARNGSARTCSTRCGVSSTPRIRPTATDRRYHLAATERRRSAAERPRPSRSSTVMPPYSTRSSPCFSSTCSAWFARWRDTPDSSADFLLRDLQLRPDAGVKIGIEQRGEAARDARVRVEHAVVLDHGDEIAPGVRSTGSAGSG